MRFFPKQVWAHCNDCTFHSLTKPRSFLGSKHWPLVNDMPSVLFLNCKISTSKHHMYSSVDHWYLWPCRSAYDQEDCPWRMMVKVAPHRRWDTISFVHCCKFLIGRAPSVLINVKRTPSKLLPLVVFISILLQHPRTIKSSRSDRCNSVVDLPPFIAIEIETNSRSTIRWNVILGLTFVGGLKRSWPSFKPCNIQFEVFKNWNRVGGVPFRKPSSGKFNKTKSTYTLNQSYAPWERLSFHSEPKSLLCPKFFSSLTPYYHKNLTSILHGAR